MDKRELMMLQALPLEIKIAKSKLRIREAIDHFGVNGVYVPVSGGKDSQVLSHLVEIVQKELNIPKEDIPRVNSNTGNEYPEVLEKARELSDVEVRPLRTLYDVLTNEGYPIASKKTSRQLRDLQNPTEKNANTRKLYLEGIKRDGTKSKSFKMAKKYQQFIDSSVKASEKCCDILKKEPLYRYEDETGRIPLLGVMADEGGTREQGYLATGCNAFSHGQSKPIGFWTEQDVLQYILNNDLKIASVYGDIERNEEGKLYTTKERRTGCMFCTLGVHMEPKENNRFLRMEKSHPRMYKFCIEGGQEINGRWVPKGGLGMWKILDMLNIKYRSEQIENPTGQYKFDI